jgi:hypothetical protein
MKHILNDLSSEERNSLLEQHKGSLKVRTENFSKLINTKLGDSKPFLAEQQRATGWNEGGEPELIRLSQLKDILKKQSGSSAQIRLLNNTDFEVTLGDKKYTLIELRPNASGWTNPGFK